MTIDDEHRVLLGRDSDQARLRTLLRNVAAGRSQVLVLRGEAGVGKTALLDYLVRHAEGSTIVRATGVESEVQLAYSVLQQLSAPFLDRIAHLPEPQQKAIGTAFGIFTGDPPDRFLVGLAVLGLFAESAEPAPLLAVVDDAHWIDTASAQTLAFVARRLAAERIGVVFAVREASTDPIETDADDLDTDAFQPLPALIVHGLGDVDAEALLDSVIAGPVDERVRSRIIAEARGNPLALLELPRDVDSAELTFGPTRDEHDPLTGRIESGFVRRLEQFPAATRQLMLVAAVEPSGDVPLLWRAAARLGIPGDAIVPAQEAGFLDVGAQARFRHPLMRSAVYRAASERERRSAHTALAESIVGDADSDYRAWHRAEAADGLDDGVAADLEISADRARTRGGWAAAAAFLTRSMELTPDPGRRARRALDAAYARMQAGANEAARALLPVAIAGPLGELDAARAELVAAQLSFASTRGREAPALLLAAAKRFETLDARVAADTYLDAFTAALFAGRLAGGGSALEDVANAILAARRRQEGAEHPSVRELLLDGLATIVTRGYASGVPWLRQALDGMLSDSLNDEDALRWLWPASRAARAIGDDAAWFELTARHVDLARRTGALTMLSIALIERFTVELFGGDLPGALAVAAEADVLATVTGSGLSPHIAFLRAAWGGGETEASALIDSSRTDVSARGEGMWLAGTELTTAVFLNAFGRYEEALVASEAAAEHPYELGLSTWVYPELIEAGVHSGHAESATGALDRLTDIAEASGTDWALGILARCRALLADDDRAEELYRESLERLARTRIRVGEARSHLVYGEWLRRAGRRVDAREQLRAAHEFFREAGMDGFAERTRRELAATGETARARSVDTTNDLTEQEALIARLAAEGRSNPEIGGQLFISPRTVEWHLGKVFTKLGVATRKELRKTIADPDSLGPGRLTLGGTRETT